MAPSTVKNTTQAANVTASVSLIPNSSARSSAGAEIGGDQADCNAHQRQSAPSRITARATLAGLAPIATRTPISRVRRETE